MNLSESPEKIFSQLLSHSYGENPIDDSADLGLELIQSTNTFVQTNLSVSKIAIISKSMRGEPALELLYLNREIKLFLEEVSNLEMSGGTGEACGTARRLIETHLYESRVRAHKLKDTLIQAANLGQTDLNDRKIESLEELSRSYLHEVRDEELRMQNSASQIKAIFENLLMYIKSPFGERNSSFLAPNDKEV